MYVHFSTVSTSIYNETTIGFKLIMQIMDSFRIKSIESNKD